MLQKSNLNSLQTSLDGKSNTSHTYTIANITDLQTNLNNRLLLTGGTLSGDLRIARSSGHTRMSISTNDTGSTADVMVYFQHGSNSTCRVGTIGPTGATRPLEIATGWGDGMPIVARQYNGNNAWSVIRRELTLLDRNGNTIIPGNLTINGTIINTTLTNLLNDKADRNHTHSFVEHHFHHEYALKDHDHDEYALKDHLHSFIEHTHPITQIDNLQTSLDGKANTSHTHTIANVTN